MTYMPEGVESEVEAEMLQKMTCTAAQGYFWSRPVDAECAFEIMTADRRREEEHGVVRRLAASG